MRRLASLSVITGFLSVAFVASPSFAQEEPESASDAKPNTVKIGGVIEAVNAKQVSADTEQVTSLTVERIIAHGTKVKSGQNLVWFETEDLDDKVKAAEIDLRLSKLTMEDDEFKHEQFLKSQKLDREAAQRARKSAQQDYDNFVKEDRDRSVKSAEFSLKSSQASLENALEELKQLQQMYDEDDLTEESEEIVLKRAKRTVESAQFRLEGTEVSTKRSIAQGIPRSVAQQDDALARAELAYQQSMRDLKSADTRKAIEIQRKRDAFKKAEEKFAELKQERQKIVLTSPIDGIALHGKLTRGKLSEKPSLLAEGSKVTPSQVLVTVVSPNALQIRVDLEEKNLPIVTKGSSCTVRLKAIPGFETKGTVKSVSAVPYAGTKYDCIVTFRAGKQAVMPTMTCELEFAGLEEAEAEVKQKAKPAKAIPAAEKKKQAAKKRETKKETKKEVVEKSETK
ncbi:MAG: HlyD family efflux transporter periplasmic adaptor subunit [Rubripirellula sp.]